MLIPLNRMLSRHFVFGCTCSCIVLPGKTRKNQSKKIPLLIICQTCLAFFGTCSFSPFPAITNNFAFFAESFRSELSKLHAPMLFWKSMFGTKRILTVITLKRHVCHIPTIGALFLQHDKVRVFFPNKLAIILF